MGLVVLDSMLRLTCSPDAQADQLMSRLIVPSRGIHLVSITPGLQLRVIYFVLKYSMSELSKNCGAKEGNPLQDVHEIALTHGLAAWATIGHMPQTRARWQPSKANSAMPKTSAHGHIEHEHMELGSRH